MNRLVTAFAILSLTCGLSAFAAPPSAPPNPQGGARPMGVPSNPNANHELSRRPETPTSRGHEQSDTRTQGRTTSEILTNNTKLSSQIQELTGMDAQQACSGFKNLGDCVSAAHASKNVGIEFGALKAKVTGTDAQDLGQAIHDLKPDAKSSDVRKARRQAKEDLKNSER